MADDGPSDEEASGGPASWQHPHQVSPRGGQYIDDDHVSGGEATGAGAGAALLPPPPPPGPPPPPSRQRSPRARARSNRNNRRGENKGGNGKSSKHPTPIYPTTIEVVSPRSRMASRARQKIHAAVDYNNHNNSYDNNNNNDSDPSCTVAVAADAATASMSRAETPMIANYESFPAPSVSNSILESSMDESQQLNKSTDQLQQQHSHHSSSSPQQPSPDVSNTNNRKTRGQVLVHYHPQLGDEGYESTLLPTPEKFSRVSRAMNAAIDRRDASPRNPTRRGMHTRAIDDVREEEILNTTNPHRHGNDDTIDVEGNNDEYNNAATRQTRRRVFRLALDRGIHNNDRRGKLRDADMDVGGPSLRVNTDNSGDVNAHNNNDNNNMISPLGIGSPDALSSLPMRKNGFGGGGGSTLRKNASNDSANEGDMPLSPRMTATPKTPGDDNNNDKYKLNTTKEESDYTKKHSKKANAVKSPPSPPTRPPSYHSIVRTLIADNEPEKLPQIDKVMEKYTGREEELIKKLDLRYRRRRAKKEMMLEDLKKTVDVQHKDKGGQSSKDDDDRGNSIEDSKEKPRQNEHWRNFQQQSQKIKQMVNSQEESWQIEQSNTGLTSGNGSKPEEVTVEKTKDKPLSALEMEGMTSPAKITFVKVENNNNTSNKNAIMVMQSWEGKEDIMDAGDGDDNDGKMDENDEPSPPPKIMKKPLPAAISDSTRTDIHSNARHLLDEEDNNSGFIGIPNIPKVEKNVENLGNQVMKERIARGKQREEQIVRATSNSRLNNNDALNTSIETKDTFESEARSVHDDYKLKTTNSYGDGISVITMETKGTMLSRSIAGQRRLGGNDEAVYSFDEMLKRPPNSITVEDNSGSFENNNNSKDGGDAADNKSPPKLQKVVPEMETAEEKARAAEESMETRTKLDDVEARIRARHRLMEEEAKQKSMSPGLMKADDELDDMESMFRTRRTPNVEENRKRVDEANTNSRSALMDAHDEGEGGDEIMREADTKTMETKTKFDYVEERILARHKMRKEEEEVKQQSMSPGLMKADEDLQYADALFRSPRTPNAEEAKKSIDESNNNGQSALMDADYDNEIEADMNSVDVDAQEYEEENEDQHAASPTMIESILSSFDEADAESFVGGHTNQQQQQHEEAIEEEAHQLASALDDDYGDSDDEAQIIKAQDTETQIIRDEGDNHTISTVGSRNSVAERAIAAATRTELQRQREVMDFHRQREVQSLSHATSNASSAGSANEQLEEEIARLIAERESRFQAEKAVALMKAHRELEAERRARLEAEAARLRAEEELERLKRGVMEMTEAVPLEEQAETEKQEEKSTAVSSRDAEEEAEPETLGLLGMLKWRKSAKEKVVQDKLKKLSPEKMRRKEGENAVQESNKVLRQLTSDEDEHRAGALAPQREPTPPINHNANSRMEAEFARLKAEQELERLKLEKMAEEAEAARLKAEVELECLKLEQASKESEAARIEAEEELMRLKMEKSAKEEGARSLDARDRAEVEARLEAEAARFKAEKELEMLKLARAAAARADEESDQEADEESDEESEHNQFKRMDAEGREDTVEKFRHCYSSEEEDEVYQHHQHHSIEQESSIEMEVMSDIENDEVDLHQAQPASFESAREVVGEEENDCLESSLSVHGSDSSCSPELYHSPSTEKESEASDQEEKVLSRGATTTAAQVNKGEHDFPSTTMVHAPKIHQDSISDAAQDIQVEKDEEDEAQIHHVARRAFEGDRSKGQISFAVGSKVEAHSNQRGPWWLGRCSGRTGWFPASAVVPASQFLVSVVNSPVSDAVVDYDDDNDVARLSGDELNAVYDLIRNPSDPAEPEENESDDDEGSPAKSRWLVSSSASQRGNATTARKLRDHSPPPSRSDPSEMAGLSERLYDSQDDHSRSNQQNVGERSQPSSVSNGGNGAPGKSDETLSKEESATAHSQLTDDSKVDTTLRSADITNKAGSKDSLPKANHQALQSGWRAAKDRNSGLVYYYHTETRETTWKKPPDFVARQSSTAPAKITTSRSASSKDKPKGGGGSKGFMGFLSKITKGRDAETMSPRSADKSPEFRKEEAKDSAQIEAVDSSKEIKPQAQTDRRSKKIPGNDSDLKLAAETEPPQNDFWSTLDDESSSASDDESTHSEGTATSIFSKQMLKTTVGKLAGTVGKLAGKISDPNRPYTTLDDSIDQGQSTPESSAHIVPARERSSVSASSNSDEHLAKEKEERNEIEDLLQKRVSKPQNKLDHGAETKHDETPSAVETKPWAQNHSQDSSETDNDNGINASDEEPKNQSSSSEEDANTNKKDADAAPKREDPAKGEVSQKKTQWRSAIDAASGRRYYYLKGTQKVTWEKPLDM